MEVLLNYINNSHSHYHPRYTWCITCFPSGHVMPTAMTDNHFNLALKLCLSMFCSVLMNSFTCILIQRKISPFHLAEGLVLFPPQTAENRSVFPLGKTGMRHWESPWFVPAVCTPGMRPFEGLSLDTHQLSSGGYSWCCTYICALCVGGPGQQAWQRTSLMTLFTTAASSRAGGEAQVLTHTITYKLSQLQPKLRSSTPVLFLF